MRRNDDRGEDAGECVSTANIPRLISRLDKEMRQTAKALDFETAAVLRDKTRSLRKQEMAVGIKVE